MFKRKEMINELVSNYLGFVKKTKREAGIAISAGIIVAITETIAIYYLSEIIKNLEYLKINGEIIKDNINLSKGLFIFLLFSILTIWLNFANHSYCYTPYKIFY